MPNKNLQRSRQRGSTRKFRSRLSSRRTTDSTSRSLSMMSVFRTLLTSLPIIKEGKFVTVLGMFDTAFNLIKTIFEESTYYNGAVTSFLITPGSLVRESILVAQNGNKLSFPGYPVSVKNIFFNIRSSTNIASKAGRWTAVFIPFREEHDASHYSHAISKLTFSEIAAMPYSKTMRVNQDINLVYKMRDLTAYCARPRELTEAIGLLTVIWDNSGRDYSQAITYFNNGDFNCEIDVKATILPHVIFGPRHRIDFNPAEFNVGCLTDGKHSLTLNKTTGSRDIVALSPDDITQSTLDAMSIV